MHVTAAGQHVLGDRTETLRHSLVAWGPRDQTGTSHRRSGNSCNASAGFPGGTGHDTSPLTQLFFDVGKLARYGGLGFHHVALELGLDSALAGSVESLSVRGRDDLTGDGARLPAVHVDEQQLLLHAHSPHGRSLPEHAPHRGDPWLKPTG